MSQSEQLQKWVDQFAASVIDQNEAILNGNTRGSNKAANACIAAFKKIREAGDAGRDSLAQLFMHSRPDVRATAAAFLLRHRTTEALAVLQQVAAGQGLVAFGAQQAIKRWEEGTWALDPL